MKWKGFSKILEGPKTDCWRASTLGKDYMLTLNLCAMITRSCATPTPKTST